MVHDLGEVPEKTGNLISRHSDSCVLDYDLKSASFPVNLPLQSHLSFFSVLDSIAEKVNNDLLESIFICKYSRRKTVLAIQHEVAADFIY